MRASNLSGLICSLLLTLPSASACPWHALGSTSPSSGQGGAGWQLIPAVYVYDRLTGKEKRYDLGRDALDLPVVNGVHCKISAPADSDMTDTYKMVCGDQTLTQSCPQRDQPDGQIFNGVDRHGMNVATVVLACEIPPDAEDTKT